MEGASISEHVSRFAFRPTLERLEQVIEQVGMTVFARIDHANAARKVGLQMPGTTVLLYGNPRGGTPLMLAAPQSALDLPLRVLVRCDANGRTVISFHPMACLLRMAGVPEVLATRLDSAQLILIEAVQPELAPR